MYTHTHTHTFVWAWQATNPEQITDPQSISPSTRGWLNTTEWKQEGEARGRDKERERSWALIMLSILLDYRVIENYILFSCLCNQLIWLKWHNRLCFVLDAVAHTSRSISRNNLINKTSKSRSDYSEHMMNLGEFLSPPPHASPSSLLVCALFLYHPPPPSWLAPLHLAPRAEVSVNLLPWWVCGPAFPPPHSVRLRPHASIRNIHSVDWLCPAHPSVIK